MESNFSKYCINEADAIETVRLYAEGIHPNKMAVKIETFYEKVDAYYIIKQKSDGKILKSFLYEEPKFRTFLDKKKEREKFILFLENQENNAGIMSRCFRRTHLNSNEFWQLYVPAVDGMQPCLRVLESSVIYSQPQLSGDSEPDEEYSFEEMKNKINF
jgi:hypothetical protein